MKRLQVVLSAMLSLVMISGASPSEESRETITEVGDALQWLLPITAGVATLFEPDWEGSKQFAYSFGSAVAINTVSKAVVGKLRPNESNTYSYPSGHTMAAFSGAGFIMQRYGPLYGWPALTAAGFVGYSRVLSENHYADDVLAGASIGLMMNWVFVTPYEGRVKVEPSMVGDQGFGMMLTVLDREPSGAAGPDLDVAKKDPRFFYIFDFGPVYNSRNEVTSPSGSTGFDLTQFDDFESQTAVSRLFLGWMPHDRHNLGLELAPYETRNKATLTDEINFQGATFDPGDVVRYAYKLYEIRLRYLYDLIENEEAWLRLGGAISYIHSSLELAEEGLDETYAQNRTDTVLPEISVSGGWWFADRLALFCDINYGQLDDERAQDLSVGVTWQIADQWNMSGGYRYYDRKINTDDWENHITQQMPFLSFGYFW